MDKEGFLSWWKGQRPKYPLPFFFNRIPLDSARALRSVVTLSTNTVSYYTCQVENPLFLKTYDIKEIMPRTSKYNLPPLNLGNESLGQRIARLRKEKGYTQIDIADSIGISQVLISDYERNKIRPHYEMIIRLAMALEVTTDCLLGVKEGKTSVGKPNLKIQQRMKKIENLPPSQQKVLLKTIDTFLKGAQA